MSGPTLSHRVEHWLFTGAGRIGGLLGPWLRDRLGAAVGRVGYRPLGIRRDVVESQLEAAFPERDEAWVRRVAAASYAHFGRESLVLLRLSRMGRDEVLRRTTVEGLDAFRDALAEGRGIVLVSGHLGNWEVAGAALSARGIPLHVIVQRQANPLFDRTINRARERLGMRVIDRRKASRLALRALRDGDVVGFVADQDARRSGVFVPFFGRPASTHRGAALMAIRTGAPVFLISGVRTDDGRYDVRLERIDADRDGDLEPAARRLTAAFTARLEAAIRRAPEQYFWHHRRWKTRPPEEKDA